MNEKVINSLVNVIDTLTDVIKDLKNPTLANKPVLVEFDEISNPFGMTESQPKEIIKEVIKEVPVEVEVIKEVIKEVPVEVIKEVTKEIIKVVDKDGYELPDVKIESIKPPRPKEIIKESSIKSKESPKAKDNLEQIPEDPHDFPDDLYHKNGFRMSKYTGVLTYKPVTGLKPNQEYYGVEGQWNVVVTYNKNKDQYITEHPEPQFNAQILYEEKPE